VIVIRSDHPNPKSSSSLCVCRCCQCSSQQLLLFYWGWYPCSFSWILFLNIPNTSKKECRIHAIRYLIIICAWVVIWWICYRFTSVVQTKYENPKLVFLSQILIEPVKQRIHNIFVFYSHQVDIIILFMWVWVRCIKYVESWGHLTFYASNRAKNYVFHVMHNHHAIKLKIGNVDVGHNKYLTLNKLKFEIRTKVCYLLWWVVTWNLISFRFIINRCHNF